MVGTTPPLQPTHAAEGQSLVRTLEELFRKQIASEPATAYLAMHGTPRAIDNHVRTFQWYRAYLPESGAILDWGCNYAPDSCLLRAQFADRFGLSSCDFSECTRYAIFHAFAATEHKHLKESIALPYESETFDAVIGSGVLEHTAMDYESLKELHRIIKPGGLAIITFLPNWLSLKEWIQRVIRKRGFHQRLYGMGEAKQLLKRAGFYPIAAGYHTFFWKRRMERVGLGRVRWLPGLLARICPMHIFSSTLCFVARRVNDM